MTSIPKSNEIRFEVINRCNYNCIICTKNKLTRPKGVMNYKTFKYLLDKITSETRQYKYVSFAGMGAPLLNPEIVDMVWYCNVKKLKPLIVTNGLCLTDDKFERLQKAGLYSIRVSFHGADPEGYCKLHGVSFNEFMRAYRNVCMASALRKKTKLLLTFVVVPGVNDAPVEKWMTMFDGLADLYEVWQAHNWVDHFDYRQIQDRKLMTCGRVMNGPLQVQVDGTVNACCFDWDGKLIYGDLITQSLKEIFSSDEYARIKTAHQTGDYADTGLICENCDQRNSIKKDILIYSSKYKNADDRVSRTSTTYGKVT